MIKSVHEKQFYFNHASHLKLIYIYASERSRFTLSENGTVYHAMTYCFGDINV